MVILDVDPFSEYRQGFGELILVVFILVALVTLAVRIVHFINGDPDALKHFLVWLILVVLGILLISLLTYM